MSTEPSKTVNGGGCGPAFMLIVSVLLCFTGIGAIIGIPMFFIILLAKHRSGHCPYCRKQIATEVSAAKKDVPLEFNCYACGRTLTYLVNDHMFRAKEEATA